MESMMCPELVEEVVKDPCTCDLPAPAESSSTTTTSGPSPKKRETKECRTESDRAQLIFPVGRIKGMIKKSVSPLRVSRVTVVAVTASLEYVIQQIIQDAVEDCKSMNGLRVKPYHLARIIHGNPAFARVFEMKALDSFPEEQKKKFKKQITKVAKGPKSTDKKKPQPRKRKQPSSSKSKSEGDAKAETPRKKVSRAPRGKKKNSNATTYDLTVPTTKGDASLQSYNPPRPVDLSQGGIEGLLKEHPL